MTKIERSWHLWDKLRARYDSTATITAVESALMTAYEARTMTADEPTMKTAYKPSMMTAYAHHEYCRWIHDDDCSYKNCKCTQDYDYRRIKDEYIHEIVDSMRNNYEVDCSMLDAFELIISEAIALVTSVNAVTVIGKRVCVFGFSAPHFFLGRFLTPPTTKKWFLLPLTATSEWFLYSRSDWSRW